MKGESGTGKQRKLNTEQLQAKMLVQPKRNVTYEDRCRHLRQAGLVIWLTGLSGSGKSTIASELEKELHSCHRAVYWLDGDTIRSGLNADLGFTEEDRWENIRRLAEVAALFKDAGIIVIVSAISPYREMRDFARLKAGKDSFAEVYVKAQLETCVSRDPKGLYRKARFGEIDNFTGISSPYDEPLRPEVVIDTDVLNIEQAVQILLEHIVAKKTPPSPEKGEGDRS